MSLLDRFKDEFIDIVEWTDDSRDTIVWRFPRHDNEIKNGARLTVRESQTAVFVNEGQIADVFGPGMYTLQTANLPILSTLKGWKHGFESPFKAEVYFVSTRQFTDLKWGTKNPVIVRDAEFGAVRLRAFGAFTARVTDPALLLRELVGTDPQFRTDEVHEYLRQNVVSRLGTALATAGVPVLDLAAHQGELGDRLAATLSGELGPELGISVPKFVIENISLPPEVEEKLDKRTSMGIVGDLDRYTKFQAAEALEAAAENPGGGAAAVVGMGLGQATGNIVAGATAPAAQPALAQPATTPPPLPGGAQWFLGSNGRQTGPFDDAGLAAQASSGALTPGTLVWRDGMPGWVAASEVPDVARHLRATPPPLPGQG
ncbi:SPFH domain-containing protein [Myceligenerans pegani]|uniref:SPFH domain-containing protein n=1 Tax=Myceligenerans pegani TaxID=2776917 RepID=A0ABR9N148_9MICO|nr:SPFH domain-containing protein [Myceligenerans sp. TRM 65318]MBE1877385.1 SPFH domain-containing protein [Myceligenerans sp. TRM 65318]MBE3019656.1 SPFH domain-containing protein [Myceligenerans sp. TRM 65318]